MAVLAFFSGMEMHASSRPPEPRADRDDTEILAWATLAGGGAGAASGGGGAAAAPVLDAPALALAFAALEPAGPPVAALATSAGGELVTFRHGDIAVRAGVVAGPPPPFVARMVAAGAPAAEADAEPDAEDGPGGPRADFHLLLGAGCAPGVESFDPVERVVALLKLAMALATATAADAESAAGGGGGVALHAFCNPANDTCLPAAALSALSAIAATGTGTGIGPADAGGEDEAGEGDDTTSLWDGLRESGAPPQLLINVVRVRDPDPDAGVWTVTRGLALCGLPELASRVVNADGTVEEEPAGAADPGDGPHARALAEARAAFHLAFGYMMHAGPVIRPGHTLGTGDGLTLAFADAPGWLEEAMDAEFGMMTVRAARPA